MVIDTSAILVIVFGESEAPQYVRALVADNKRLVSAPTMLEASIVCLKRLGEVGLNELDLFSLKSGISVVPFDSNLLALARKAFRRYGKGIHATNLNFGDCFSYALSKHTQEPILFKGTDFDKTDLKLVAI
jgi:ribonuclease VapC